MTQLERIEEWREFADVDEWVKEAASLYATTPALKVEMIASYMEKPVEVVKTAFAHALVQQYINRLQADVVLKRNGSANTLTEIRETAYEKILAMVKSGEVSLKDLTAVAKFASDYNPDREFTKMERREERITHTHQVSGHTLQALKERHMLACSPTEPIQVVAEEIDSA
jgi:hypothetical protein